MALIMASNFAMMGAIFALEYMKKVPPVAILLYLSCLFISIRFLGFNPFLQNDVDILAKASVIVFCHLFDFFGNILI